MRVAAGMRYMSWDETLNPKPLNLVNSRSPKVGNPIASILKSNEEGISEIFGLHPVANFMEFTVNPIPMNPKPPLTLHPRSCPKP